MNLFKKKPILDAEMDIEGLSITAIDRRGNDTVFGIMGRKDEWVRCTPEKTR